MEKAEKTQSEFDEYIKKLPFTEKCKYMGGMAGIVNLCNNPLFKCTFRKVESYHHQGEEKQECTREQIAKLKKILGNLS